MADPPIAAAVPPAATAAGEGSPKTEEMTSKEADGGTEEGVAPAGTLAAEDDASGQRGVAQVEGAPDDQVVVVELEDGAGEEEEGEDLGDDQRQPVGGEGCQNAHGGDALRLCCLFLVTEAALEMRMYDSQWLRGGRACCCAPK